MLAAAGIFILGWIGIVVVAAGNGALTAEVRLNRIAEGAGSILTLVLIAWTLLWLIFSVLYLLGAVFCCWVPARSGARPLILAIAALSGLSLLLVLGGLGLRAVGVIGQGSFGLQGADFELVFALVLVVPFLPAFGLLFFFLRALAIYLDDEGSVQETFPILITLTCLTVAAPFIFAGLVAMAMLSLMGIVLLVGGVVVWGFFWGQQWVRLINLMAGLRQSLENLRQREEKSLFRKESAR